MLEVIQDEQRRAIRARDPRPLREIGPVYVGKAKRFGNRRGDRRRAPDRSQWHEEYADVASEPDGPPQRILVPVEKVTTVAEIKALTSAKTAGAVRNAAVGPQPPSPGDFQRRLNQALGESVSTAGLAEKQNRRFAFVREHVPEALESVLHDRGVERVDLRGLDAFR